MNIHAIGQVASPMTTFYLALKLKAYPEMHDTHLRGWKPNRLPLAVEMPKGAGWVYSVAGVACDVYKIVTQSGGWESNLPATRFPMFWARRNYAAPFMPKEVLEWLGYEHISVSPPWTWLSSNFHEAHLDHALAADQIINLTGRSKQVMDDIITLYGEVMASDIPTWR